MIEHLKAFLQFLALNRNASAHTVRAYESDLSQFIGYVAARRRSEEARSAAVAARSRRRCAAFSASCTSRGCRAPRRRASSPRCARSSAICAAKSVIDDDPGGLVATPKRDIRMPAHLSEAEMTALLDAPAGDTPLVAPRPRDPRAVLRLGPAPERAGRPRRRGCEPEREDGAGARQGREGADRAVQRQHGEGDPRVSERSGDRCVAASARIDGAGRRYAVRQGRHATRAARRARRRRDPLFVNYRGGRLTVRSVDRLVRRYVAASSARLASARTRCGIRSRRICCSAAPTCARSRNCSATRASARRSATRTSTPRSCSRSTANPTRAHSSLRRSRIHSIDSSDCLLRLRRSAPA